MRGERYHSMQQQQHYISSIIYRCLTRVCSIGYTGTRGILVGVPKVPKVPKCRGTGIESSYRTFTQRRVLRWMCTMHVLFSQGWSLEELYTYLPTQKLILEGKLKYYVHTYLIKNTMVQGCEDLFFATREWKSNDFDLGITPFRTGPPVFGDHLIGISVGQVLRF